MRTVQNTKRWNKHRFFSAVFQFLVLYAFWFALSGHLELEFVLMGAGSSVLVTLITNAQFYASLQRGIPFAEELLKILVQIWRWFLYLPWLLYQIILANIQVAYLVLHPRLPIDPGILLFKTGMKKGLSRVTLANSITLTPGTVTIDLEEGNYFVHTLKPPLAGGLIDASMQNKVAHVFLEKPEAAPKIRWVYRLEDLR